MHIILPPSETKAPGGDGGPLEPGVLSLPVLAPTRERVAMALVDLCSGDPDAAAAALGLSPRMAGAIEENRDLLRSPTAPALARYTGVLYDAFDAESLTAAARARVEARVLIGSALFGLVGAADRIPRYRLSAGSTLPSLGASLRAVWRPVLPAALDGPGTGLVVDLRSGAYRQLGPVPGAVTVRVVTEFADGNRKVVSHFNKHHKGLLARVLATSRAEIEDVPALLRVTGRAGMRIETPTSGAELTMVVPAPG